LCPIKITSFEASQRKLSKNIVLELRTFVLRNRVGTFWYQYKNEMVRIEKLN